MEEFSGFRLCRVVQTELLEVGTRVPLHLSVRRLKVIRVVAICHRLTIVDITEQSNFRLGPWRLHAFQVSHVVRVHTEDDVECVEVLGFDAAGGVGEVDRDVTTLAEFGGAFVGFFASVIGGGTAGVEDVEVGTDARGCGDVGEDGERHR